MAERPHRRPPRRCLATGNAAHELGDGALLVLTEVREADRAGRVHGTAPTVPDALAAAWLNTVSAGR